MPGISVIVVTAREESESFFPAWKEIADCIRSKRRCRYKPLSLVREPFRSLLLKCVKSDQRSFLEPTLESLKLQTFKDFEIIIVDWHRDERSWISEKFEDLRIKHVRDKPSPWHNMKPPKGWEAKVKPAFPAVNNARNTGVILAEGELLCFLDDNILLEPRVLETCWKWHLKGYGVKLIRNRFNIYESHIVFEPEFKGNLMHNSLWEKGWCPYSYQGAWSHGFTVRLEHMLQINGFEEVLLDGTVGAEDIDCGKRLSNLLEKEEKKYRMVLDVNATVWELGHIHIQEKRPCVRLNIELLKIVRNWNECVKANERKPTERELKEYKKRMLSQGERLHPYWSLFPVEPFNLRELRERYWRGEFKW